MFMLVRGGSHHVASQIPLISLQANAYWAMYRVARNYPSLVTTHNWQWYLNQAVATVKSVTAGGRANENDGWMDETVFRYILEDLQREGLTANASLVESRMKARQAIWATERYPCVSIRLKRRGILRTFFHQ